MIVIADSDTFKYFRNKLKTIEQQLYEIKREVRTMAATQQELKDAITSLGIAVQADSDQDQLVITKIEDLIKKIKDSPSAPDFTQEVAALSAAITSLQGSNDKIKTELDKANA